MKSVEEFRGFPVIAWTTVILFAAFTANLAIELNHFTEHILPVYSLTESR